MPSLKSLRIRINSVKATQKITKAMKMVAASRLRRAQEAAIAARPYAQRMERMLASLGASVRGAEGAPRLLVGTGADKVHLLVVATGERGLCGAFNSSIVRLARRHIQDLLAAGKTVKILTVGKKGRDQLRRDHASRFVEHVDLSHVRRVGFANAKPIADKVIDLFAKGEFDVCTVFFATFRSVIKQEPTALQLIPAAMPETNATPAEAGLKAQYEYEPEEDELLAELLPRNLAVQVFRSLLENSASEQGARMSAMDSATRNAGDMIGRLTLVYNRTRQASITKELIEIVSGAEAL
ncbi:MAG: F0F1 ATP synthase subunit gamma [Alphaproteobacteria bacterium]|nr:F0F1 ATP synthase subunit gamma [Alphaproteobacteria bacterium]